MARKNSNKTRIDRSVILLMVSISLISFVVLAFRYQTTEPCSEIRIQVKSDVFYEGSLIRFSVTEGKGRRYQWSFSDGYKTETSTPEVRHAFFKEGEYTVSVKVDNRCNGLTTVAISDAPQLITGLPGSIIAPDTVYVDKPVRFRDTTSDASSWEWNFGESDIYYTERDPVYTYMSPGDKTIFLKINGRADRVYSRTIYVKQIAVSTPVTPARPAPIFLPGRKPNIPVKPSDNEIRIPETPMKTEDSVKMFPLIHANEMVGLIEEVVAGKRQDLQFHQYFCDNKDITVMYNGKEMSFSQMCSLLRKFKSPYNITKPEVELQQSRLNNCISRMTISVRKRKLTEKLLNKNN